MDRFEECEWEWSDHNLPVLAHSAAVLQCSVFNKVDAGDHIILIGEVIDIHNAHKAPLLYHRRNIGAIPDSFYN